MKMLSKTITTFLNGSTLLNYIAGITSVCLLITLLIGSYLNIPVILGDDSPKNVIELQILTACSCIFWFLYVIFRWTEDQESALKSINLMICALYNIIIANDLAQQYPPYDALIDILSLLSIFYSLCSLSLISHEIGRGDNDDRDHSNDS